MAIQYIEINGDRVLTVIDTLGDITPSYAVGPRQGMRTNQSAGHVGGGANLRENEIIRVEIYPCTQGDVGNIDPSQNFSVSGAWAPSGTNTRRRLLRADASTIDATFEIMYSPTQDFRNDESFVLRESETSEFGSKSLIFQSDVNAGSGFISVRKSSQSTNNLSYAVVVRSVPNVR